MCAFLDIDGAFDNTSFHSIERAALRKGCEITTVRWIKSMLKSRQITANIGGTAVSVLAKKGCPQGGVLSPLLWSMVVDNLITELNDARFNTQGYADDLVVMIVAKHDDTLSQMMQNALNMINNWCLKEDLNINPNKTVIVPFTNRRKLNLTTPSLGGTKIGFSKEVKYLGVILDAKLNWNNHLEKVRDKSTKAFWICRRYLGKT